MAVHKIKIEVDNGQAVAASKQTAAAQRQVGDEAAKAAARMQQEFDRAIARELQAARRAADQKAREDRRQLDSRHREMARALDREVREAQQAAKRKADAEDREAKRAQRAREQAAKQAAKKEQQALDQGRAAAVGMSRSLVDLAGNFGLVTTASGAISAIGQLFDQTNRSVIDAAKFVADYREALLELAALKGQLGNSTQATAEDIAFRAKTLQTADQARQFQLQALGAGEAGIDANGVQKRISKDEFANLMALAGGFQAAEGGDAGTHGRLAGMIPMLMSEKRVTGQQAFGKEQQLYNIFKPGGASFTQLTDQLLKGASYSTTGLFKDIADQAALLSSFSVTKGAEAGTTVDQFVRATVGGLGRMRGVQAMPGESFEKQGQYLKGLGATNQMDPIEIGKLISKDFARQEQAAGLRGERFNPVDYLRHHGYMNQEDIQALALFHGQRREFENTFQPLANAAPGGGAAAEQLRRFQQVDPVGLGRKAQIADEAAKVAVGAGPQEYMQSLMKATFAKMKAEGQITGEYEDIANPSFLDMVGFYRRGRVQQRAQRDLQAEARRVGLGEQADAFGAEQAWEGKGAILAAPSFYRFAGQVGAAGGDILPGTEVATEAAEKMLKAANIMEAAAAKGLPRDAPKAAPPAPLQPPRRGVPGAQPGRAG